MYKKGVLSLVASAFLCGNIYADTVYLPLTTSEHDDEWVLFGVNGYAYTPPTIVAPTTVTSNATTLVDTDTTDNIATSGLDTDNNSSTDTNLGSVQALADAPSPLTYISVGVDISGVTYVSTEPIRSMYIDATGPNDTPDGVADLKFSYKESLEGKTLELQKKVGGEVYTTTINYNNTYNNPAKIVKKATATATSSTLSATNGSSELSTITDIMDYNLSNNPSIPTPYFDKVGYQDATPANSDTKARIYTFDSITSSWKLWDRKNSAIANDFNTLEKGRAYWGKIDIAGDGNGANDGAGLILGTSGQIIADPTVYTNKLADGWNLISLDEANPSIITSSTGIIANISKNGNIIISDDTNIYDVNITLSDTNISTNSIEINKAIEIAKGQGEFPSDTYIKAFPTSNSKIALLSNKRFILKDTSDDKISDATTIAGQNLFDIGSSALKDYSGGDVDENGVRSVYGEYSLIIEPLVGSNSVAQLDKNVSGGGSKRSAAIQIGDDETSLVYLADNDDDSSLDKLETNIEANKYFDGTTAKGQATQIDISFDEVVDRVMLVSTKPFYIKDHTFTRAYKFDKSKLDGTKNFVIKADSEQKITPANDDNVSNIVDDINNKADDASATATGVYAKLLDDNLTIVTASTSNTIYGLFNITSTSSDILSETTVKDDVIKGAVSGVYTIEALSKKDLVTNSFKLHGLTAPSSVDDNLSVTINGSSSMNIDLPNTTEELVSGESDTPNKKAYFDAVVRGINKKIASEKVYATASHDYTVLDNPNFADVNIYVKGFGITSVDLNASSADGTDETNASGVDENAGDIGHLSNISADLTDDLKYNAIYSPSYTTYGPLYTLKKAGFEPKSIITSTTDLKTGSIKWTNIDLTKDISLWFSESDSSIFNISSNKGYWVYLSAYASAPTITATTPIFTPTFTYNYFPDGTTINNLVGGQFTVTVDGITKGSPKVTALVQGYEIPLISQSSTENKYTGVITKYEASNIVANGTSPISVGLTVSNGLGDVVEVPNIYSIDYTKPTKPTVSVVGGLITFTSSDDTKSFYMFNNDYIPEDIDTANSTALVKVASTGATASYNLCKDINFAYVRDIKAIAIDGSGTLGSGNASDSISFRFTNTLRKASVLSHTYDATGETSSSLGTLYDENCQAGATATQDYGVSIKTITADKTIKLSYVPDMNVSFSNDLPFTTYVEANGIVVQLKSMPEYATNPYFIDTGSGIYMGNFPSNENNNTDSSNPLPLTSINSANISF